MKRITSIIAAMFIAAASCTVHAQSEAEMKAWMDYMTPGDVHKMLASWDGEWNDDITMWMSPDGPPAKNTGTTTNKMGLGGRYQFSTHTGSFNGMPFEGMNTLAYDNAKKVMESVWIDNMGTGIMHLQGPWDPATKTITLTGKMLDPTTGKETSVKQVVKIVDDNTQIMEMYGQAPDGKEFKSMEIKSTRKK